MNSLPVVPGTFFKCSDSEANTLEIDYNSIAAMNEEDMDALSPVEYRFLEWVVFEELQMKDRKTVFLLESVLPGLPHIFDCPQSEICTILLVHLGIPLPTE